MSHTQNSACRLFPLIAHLILGRLQLLDAALMEADVDVFPCQTIGTRGRGHDEGDACWLLRRVYIE